MRTSVSHPLQIAEVSGGPRCGRIGITFCPGKYDPHALSGAWRRDLAADLDVIRDWGAAAVVTLVEARELAMLRVNDLGAEVRRRHMQWLHLPIVDVSTPDQDFEAAWATEGEALRAILRSGFDVLVHCRGGLGRAGTIAARLLVELGVEPAGAVKQVRRVRPGAIETPLQKQHVLNLRAAPEPRPAPGALRDRATGALAGLAVGEAVARKLQAEATHHRTWDDDVSLPAMVGEPLRAETYSADPSWPNADLENPGALLRMASGAIRCWNDKARLQQWIVGHRPTSAAAAEIADACTLLAEVLSDAIAGLPRSAVLRARAETDALRTDAIRAVAAGHWRGRNRVEMVSRTSAGGLLAAALWCVGSTADFRSAVLKAVQLDSGDVLAAVTGQLAGALHGSSAIPAEWAIHPADQEKIVQTAAGLLENIAANGDAPE